MSSVRVKIARDKLIAALEDRITKSEEAKTENESRRILNDVAKAEYANEIVNLVKSGKVVVSNVNKRSWASHVSVDFEPVEGFALPQEPEFELAEGELPVYQVNEIRNAIRLLNLSDEETVNTSTYKSVVGYL